MRPWRQLRVTPRAKVLRHVVMYKFKDGLPVAQIQEVVDAFAGLPKKIDTILGFEKGTNVSAEGKSEGFTHMFVVTFKDQAGLDVYLKHPAHDDYVKVVKDLADERIEHFHALLAGPQRTGEGFGLGAVAAHCPRAIDGAQVIDPVGQPRS